MTDTPATYTCSRDYQLFGPGPKRVLALDGGGVRGAITVAFLERMETILSAQLGEEFGWGIIFTSSAGPRPEPLSQARSPSAFEPHR